MHCLHRTMAVAVPHRSQVESDAVSRFIFEPSVDGGWKDPLDVFVGLCPARETGGPISS